MSVYDSHEIATQVKEKIRSEIDWVADVLVHVEPHMLATISKARPDRMENREFARVLAETADLMEIAGEDGFRIRSYRNAASAIEGYPERVDDILANPERKVTEIPGIGKGIASVLEELAKRGSFEKRDALLAQFPPTLLELVQDPGPGPEGHRAGLSALQGRDHRRSGAHLQRAKAARTAAHGRQARREGAQVDRAYRQRTGRFLLSFGQKVAGELIPYLSRNRRASRKSPPRAVCAAARKPSAISICWSPARAPRTLSSGSSRIPRRTRFSAKASNKASIQYGLEGLQVDLRALPHESYGAALQYFTGSKEHNIVLRSRALKLGLTLNEYGLFQAGSEARVAGETEEEVYAALGLPWIPPELRENCGEIEAALEGRCRS